MTMKCAICKRLLNNPADMPESKDCGGDCLACMAECGDPGCIIALALVAAMHICQRYAESGCDSHADWLKKFEAFVVENYLES